MAEVCTLLEVIFQECTLFLRVLKESALYTYFLKDLEESAHIFEAFSVVCTEYSGQPPRFALLFILSAQVFRWLIHKDL